MNDLILSNRLQLVADQIPDDIHKFADIGSDHAYLPCYVCKQQASIHAIAGEVNEGPYQAAVNQVEKYQLLDQIEVRLGDGLAILQENEVDCITIAGMGGTLITHILLEGLNKLGRVKRLILQPNIDAFSIRRFAVDHQYRIIHEDIINDEGYIYEVLVLEPSDEPVQYSEKELYLGPILLGNRNEVFYEKWGHVFNKKQKIINQMQNAKAVDDDKLNYFIKQTQWIEEAIDYDSNNG
ncbi:tRNA (adenine(22)-N(1))-methyltransferase [Tenuibacillus multivorans]|uniref:tRNA (Adenine22-N1)-methyltransferase n=1 Tax=Tenuibacillus multivorans TaxID=237069 RepID=A0A1G9ZCK2_9BACI|nr:tRNA (adenine(22)-N(1))-methyltransferase TrmK [Tenuibacillus multivorans]GEL78302.1 SAM-dependent methyltransferase [Tenuibacillus multivorans]SDN18905.1 tRNA (adenine22-N1)-methyltransferase [Tenuibacillus multivorans]